MSIAGAAGPQIPVVRPETDCAVRAPADQGVCEFQHASDRIAVSGVTAAVTALAVPGPEHNRAVTVPTDQAMIERQQTLDAFLHHAAREKLTLDCPDADCVQAPAYQPIIDLNHFIDA